MSLLLLAPHIQSIILFFILLGLLPLTQPWLMLPRPSRQMIQRAGSGLLPASPHHPHHPYQRRERGRIQCSGGLSGWGRVNDRYSWTENEWELEVSVTVPPQTKKEDVLFKASATSLKLGLVNSTELLLGGKLKGRIAMDGTYWSIEGEGPDRAVKLLLEKKDGALENSWDWRRVFVDEAATESEYKEAERFDTKEYIHQMLGPEGINMDLVDKDMFGSEGLMQNVSKETLKEYVEQKVLDDASGLFPSKVKGGGGGKKEEKAEKEERQEKR